MPLIDLKTNLKDLKYGHDQRNGESSAQPFVPTTIPASEDPLPNNYFPVGKLYDSANPFDIKGNIKLNKDTLADTAVVIGAATVGGLLIGGPIGAAVAGGAAAVAGGALLVSQGDLEANVKIKFNPYEPFPAISGTGGPDFLVRGGLLLPSIVFKDAARLSRFFQSWPGLAFTLKQNLLSRASVRSESVSGLFGAFVNSGVYTPLSSVLGAVGSPFGLHPNKQGLNPLQGIVENWSPGYYYENIASDNYNILYNPNSNEDESLLNRLVGLQQFKILTLRNDRGNFAQESIGGKSRKNDISGNPNFILSYTGGPGSFLGTIGRTRLPLGTDQYNQPLTVKNAWYNNPYKNVLIAADISSSANFNSDVSKILGEPDTMDFRRIIRNNKLTGSLIYGKAGGQATVKAPIYGSQGFANIQTRTGLGDPGTSFDKNIEDYQIGNPDTSVVKLSSGKNIPGFGRGAASPYSYDQINAFGDWGYTANEQVYGNFEKQYKRNKDLVDFKIAKMGTKEPNNMKTWEFFHFRAFLDQISDNYTSNWDPQKYIGRSETFYTYTGFERKVSLGWTVAAQSKVELMSMYRRLNRLASICAGDYSSEGYLRGNMVSLTIGGYLYEQPGIITGFNYEMNNENDTWEIGIDTKGNTDQSVKQLPHLIRVTGFNFIPIHKFTPKYQYVDSQETGDIYGPERFISLANFENDNYNTTQTFKDADGNPFPGRDRAQ
jgi:hypothetical protein